MKYDFKTETINKEKMDEIGKSMTDCLYTNFKSYEFRFEYEDIKKSYDIKDSMNKYRFVIGKQTYNVL